MDRSIEKAYKKIQEAVDKEDPKDEQELNALVSQIFENMNKEAKTKKNSELTPEELSDKYYEKACNAKTKETAIKNADKAIQCDPSNLDAKVFRASLNDTTEEKLAELDQILVKEEKKLKKEGFFDNVGEFWLMFETRPYMRALVSKMNVLSFADRNTEAIAVAERIIELCENDNLGTRYNLMSYYALFEQKKKAEALFNKFHKEDSLGLLLPLSICYYRCGEYSKCKEILRHISEINKYAEEILCNENYLATDKGDFFSPGKESEVMMALDVCDKLLYATPTYFDFVYDFFKGK